MTTHELYINDTLVDLDKDVNIYLLYQSMLFTDLQGIVSNRSYNVSLPKTAANLNAISHYNLADVSDETAEGSLTFPRKYHKVSYYRNGITIFENGIGTFISIDSRINFAFSFGNAENFQKLFERNLNELPDNSYIAWNNNTPYVHLPNFENYGLLDIDFGQGSNKQYQHPTVASYYILDQIEKQSGITFEKTGNPPTYKYGLGSYLVPLVTKKAPIGLSGWSKTQIAIGDLSIYSESPVTKPVPVNFSIKDNKGYVSIYSASGNNTTWKSLHDGLLEFNLSGCSGISPSLCVSKNGDTSRCYFVSKPNPNAGQEEADNYVYLESLFVHIKADETFRVYMLMDNYPAGHYSIFNGTHNGTPAYGLPYISFSPTESFELSYPNNFSIVPNLPDIKQSNFLKGLMQISGVFPYVKAENTIGFISVDDIIAKKNKSDTKDWTGKLLNTPSTTNAPEGVEFKLENFAQRNICKWDEGDDETLKGKYDGVMVVNNETIEKERECFKLPFAPTANVEYVNGEYKTKRAKIPVYTNDGGTVEYNDDITPRILNTKHVDGYSGASFEGMDLASVISTRYKSYQDIIRTPRVIKVKCLLNDYDLSTLDLTAPVYFEQFGNYYAILKVQAAADGVCKCEFLEI